MTSKCCICDEKFNNREHAPINCMYCSHQGCRTCCKTYILGQSTAKCMGPSCGKEWTRKFLVEQFPKSFIVGELKQHQERLLFEKELALLPAAQQIIEEKKEKQRLLHEKHIEIREVRQRIKVHCRELTAILDKLQREERALELKKPVTTPKTFIRACSVEDCRGFLSTKWKCGLCDTYTCPECYVTKSKTDNDPHECKPDDLATARLMKTDTKCCPKCATGIFKIDGCDQMWCTQCHTAFSWNTGRVETRIHNPHYYEYQRNHGIPIPRAEGDDGDVRCNGQAIALQNYDAGIIEFNLKTYLGLERGATLDGVALDIVEEMSTIIRSAIHLQQVLLPRYENNANDTNLDLRIEYLNKVVSKDTFQTNVQRRNKKREKKQEMYDIINLFITTVTDIRSRLTNELKETINVADLTLKNVIAIVRETDHIVEYVNTCLDETAKTFNSTPYMIEISKRDFVLIKKPVAAGTKR